MKKRSECTCPCHTDLTIMHKVACCEPDSGHNYIEITTYGDKQRKYHDTVTHKNVNCTCPFQINGSPSAIGDNCPVHGTW